jgi:hypothetical protein
MIRIAVASTSLTLLASCAVAPEGGGSAPTEDRYADFGGVKIRYIDVGRGEPIVLLHGGTSNLESWVRTGVVANLSKDYRVIAFDARSAGWWEYSSTLILPMEDSCLASRRCP